MASQTDAWTDFEALRNTIRLNTVEKLKLIVIAFNEECGSNLTRAGKKQELIDRIIREVDIWKRLNNVDRWARGKAILTQVRQTGSWSSTRTGADHIHTNGMASHGAYPGSSSLAPAGYGAGSSAPNIPRYDPYAPPRRPSAPSTSVSAPIAPHVPIRFATSPFFRVERPVSSIIECPESTSQVDRRSQILSFPMTVDILTKLNTPNPKYQLRLYCTSSSYYSPNLNAFRSSGPCLIEFPPTCEVRVNNVQLNSNLKGMKKKPGTAPPPDLGKSLRLTNGTSNRVEMVYVNSQQPVQTKKYYLVVMLVEVTSVEQLIDRLKKGKYKSSAEIRAKMAQNALEDDDIVAGQQTMSLKCPLSYVRISTPCRSSTCPHPQCFDALSWFSMMEQTTTWLCPVCEKALNVDELMVDGYFDEILKETPDSVDDVIVESDGQWHSTDNKFGSADWKATHSLRAVPAQPLYKAPMPMKQRSISPAKLYTNGTGVAADKPRQSNDEIVILDSDDEDEEGRVKRELSPSFDRAPLSANNSFAIISGRPVSQLPSQVADIIDLTLDSDSEEPPRTVPLTKKRKTSEMEGMASPTEQIWKKSRSDGPTSSSPGSVHNAIHYNSAHYPAHTEYSQRSCNYEPVASSSSAPPPPPRYPPPTSYPLHIPSSLNVPGLPPAPPLPSYGPYTNSVGNPYNSSRLNGGTSSGNWRP